MRIIATDDEFISLKLLQKAIEEACPDAELHCFPTSQLTLDFARENTCDIAFLDIQMRGMDGLTLARHLKDISPNINIIFVTGYDEYSESAFRLHASGYVLKPPTKERVLAELSDLRHPMSPIPGTKLRVRCFGRFEVYHNEEPLHFERSHTKELLAYLILLSGSDCSADELISVLWEDAPNSEKQQAYLRVLTADLKNSLAAIGAQDVLIRRRNSWAIQKKLIDCDYYRMKEGDATAVNAYNGEFMVQYSWAEFAAGALTSFET